MMPLLNLKYNIEVPTVLLQQLANSQTTIHDCFAAEKGGTREVPTSSTISYVTFIFQYSEYFSI